ncbi:hypothetical protein ACI2L1_29940 [Streptomyces sp. NPDC019531]|uniref:hypothetical protein n=1 Tax=Streptomyces sp. NPDC019531 TaxID=3365062 RepID=UPI00384EE0E6
MTRWSLPRIRPECPGEEFAEPVHCGEVAESAGQALRLSGLGERIDSIDQRSRQSVYAEALGFVCVRDLTPGHRDVVTSPQDEVQPLAPARRWVMRVRPAQ